MGESDAQSVPCQLCLPLSPPCSRSLIVRLPFTDTLFPRNGEIGCPHPGMEETGISFFWCSYMNPAGILGSPPGQSLLLAWLAPPERCAHPHERVCLNSVMTASPGPHAGKEKQLSKGGRGRTETNTRCPLWGLLWFGASTCQLFLPKKCSIGFYLLSTNLLDYHLCGFCLCPNTLFSLCSPFLEFSSSLQSVNILLNLQVLIKMFLLPFKLFPILVILPLHTQRMWLIVLA